MPYKVPGVDLVLYANGNANMMSDFATFLPLVCRCLNRWSAAIINRGKIRRIVIMKEQKLILWDGSEHTTVLKLNENLPTHSDTAISIT